jgi:hypothetical protein
MPLRLEDDRKQELLFLRPPRRVVSLVPSDTLSVIALGAGSRLVGRTRYCDAPSSVAVVGGTKDVDVEAVAALEPDLVLANQEENSRAHVEALIKRQLNVYVSFPKTVAQGFAHLARLAKILECGTELVRRGYAALAVPAPAGPPVRAFVPIWMDPLMTIGGETFISDALRLSGAENVFADRVRRYPLAADLRGQPAGDPGQRDVRYPRVTLDEVVSRAPSLVLLPDEPHPFSEADAAVFRALPLPGAKVQLCGGRDLSWYGAQSVDGLPRLRALIASLR